jgi:hypothetical protein
MDAHNVLRGRRGWMPYCFIYLPQSKQKTLLVFSQHQNLRCPSVRVRFLTAARALAVGAHRRLVSDKWHGS